MSSNNTEHTYDGIREDREQKPPAYFNLLFYGLIIWGLLFCAYYLLSGWSSQGEFQEKMSAHKQKAASSFNMPAQPDK